MKTLQRTFQVLNAKSAGIHNEGDTMSTKHGAAAPLLRSRIGTGLGAVGAAGGITAAEVPLWNMVIDSQTGGDDGISPHRMEPGMGQYAANFVGNLAAMAGLRSSYLRGTQRTMWTNLRDLGGAGISAPTIHFGMNTFPAALKVVDDTTTGSSGLASLGEQGNAFADRVEKLIPTLEHFMDPEEGIPNVVNTVGDTADRTLTGLQASLGSINMNPVYYGMGALGGGALGTALGNILTPNYDDSDEPPEVRKRNARIRTITSVLGALAGAGAGAYAVHRSGLTNAGPGEAGQQALQIQRERHERDMADRQYEAEQRAAAEKRKAETAEAVAHFLPGGRRQ